MPKICPKIMPEIGRKANFRHSGERKQLDRPLDGAIKLIRSQVDPWFTSDIQVLGYKSGIRVYRSLVSSFPIIDQLDNKTWCFTGLGSRGLMYHAYLGSILAKAILQQSPKLIPQACKITK